MLVSQHLAHVALEKGLRQSTVYGYERLLRRLNLLDTDVAAVEQANVIERLWEIDSPNSRRSAVIMLRSVFGWNVRIPKQIPKRYSLPSEDTLRMALMLSPHEARGLLMMYAGLRIGEACAVTGADIEGDRLTVAKQVIELHRTGSATTWRIGPVKTSEATIIIPLWLTPIISALDSWDKPGRVRESLRRGGNKVGIKLTPHQLRHWYATTLLERGVPLALVSKQMRHSDIATTLRTYSQYNDGDIHKALG